MACIFFFQPFFTIPVALIITGVILHFGSHILLISMHKLLYFSFFSVSFCTNLCWYFHIYQCACFLLFVRNYNIMPICCNFSVHVCCLFPQQCNIFLFIHWLGRVCVCVPTIFLSFQCLGLCILSNANVHRLYRVSFSIHSSPKWSTLRLGSQ